MSTQTASLTPTMADKLEQNSRTQGPATRSQCQFHGQLRRVVRLCGLRLPGNRRPDVFPQTDKATALLATFAVFALSFIVRPLGGLVWGHFGRQIRAAQCVVLVDSDHVYLDLLHRHPADLQSYRPVGAGLVVADSLVQGAFPLQVSTPGLRPFSPSMRLEGKRGLYTSIVPASTAAGLLFGAVFVAGLHAWMSVEDLHSWGWRLPSSLLAAPFGLVGRYIRMSLQDTPKFLEMEKTP